MSMRIYGMVLGSCEVIIVGFGISTDLYVRFRRGDVVDKSTFKCNPAIFFKFNMPH